MRRIYILLVILLISVNRICYADNAPVTLDGSHLTEIQTRQYIFNLVKQALDHSDFKLLEELSNSYRVSKERTPSGLWKLSVFYGSFWFKPDEQSFLAREKLIDDWIKAYPQSPSAYIMKSKTLIDHGWWYRGDKMVNETPPEAWKPFFQYVHLAEENLEKSKSISGRDPEWYSVMFKVATADNWEKAQFEMLVKEAVAQEPYYYDNYFQALRYLLPKWKGSFAEADAFARRAEEWTSDKDGHSIYARIYWYLDQTDINHLFKDDPVISWDEMKKSFEDMMQRYPDEWNLQNYAKFACIAGDKTTAHRLITQIWNEVVVYPQKFGKNINLDTLRQAWDIEHTGDLFTRCKQWANDPASTAATAPSEDNL